MCVNINKAFNVLCSQSLCEVVVNSCRELELQSKSSVMLSRCRVAVSGILSLALLSSLLY